MPARSYASKTRRRVPSVCLSEIKASVTDQSSSPRSSRDVAPPARTERGAASPGLPPLWDDMRRHDELRRRELGYVRRQRVWDPGPARAGADHDVRTLETRAQPWSSNCGAQLVLGCSQLGQQAPENEPMVLQKRQSVL